MSETLASDPNRISRDYVALRTECGLYLLTEHSLLEMRGDDRKAWLQGQITNDIRKLGVGGSMSACICSPTGQLVAHCTIWSFDDRYLISTSKHSMPALLHRIGSMVIMEDVQAELLTDFDWYSLQGPIATRALTAVTEVPTLDVGRFAADPNILLLRTNWTGLGGWDLVVPKGTQFPNLEVELVSPEAFNIARLEAGLPLFGKDLTDKTLPPEMGQDFEQKNISYNKGCYVGQEVLMRIHSRGHTNKTWMGLLLDDPVDEGARILSQRHEDVGFITSFAGSPKFGPIAGGFLKNEAAVDGEIVKVQSSNREVEAEVHPMPLLRPF